MADIELVIKIPEEAYKLLKNEGVDWLGAEHILNAVANGTSLPKGHGKIIDATFALEAKITKDNIGVSERTKGWNEACQAIYENAQTIIEADTEPIKENLIEQLIDDIEGLTWYRNVHGNLVEGATSETGLYKASDIAKILEKYKRGVEK